jgi:exodeoxyribonuclease VII small subunit
MAKRSNQPSQSEPAEIPFEEALGQLESIIEAMEHESLPLEQLVSQYETGSKLLARCESLLQSARDRVELITLRGSSSSETSPTGQTAPEDTESDDIRLF